MSIYSYLTIAMSIKISRVKNVLGGSGLVVGVQYKID